ncbi:hypothetical protein EVAR_81787_1 [Eumeta japonica]|uniref:Uncharacterized protein n=1 Tax=Eumeta variegata TaxID=151549 RepID=A0A4C1UIV2_EUMVA|nr:hypothetical protein EVAR_81787_1 [Eumeta japonica]
MSFCLKQVLSGHGCFWKYLYQIVKKERSAECHQCGVRLEDTAQGILEICPAWETQRATLTAVKEVTGRKRLKIALCLKSAADILGEGDNAYTSPIFPFTPDGSGLWEVCHPFSGKRWSARISAILSLVFRSKQKYLTPLGKQINAQGHRSGPSTRLREGRPGLLVCRRPT